MNTIIQKIYENKIDYEVITHEVIMKASYSPVKAIIGVRGRNKFIHPTITSLQKAGVSHITIVEHADKLQHMDRCRQLKVNYIGIPLGGMYSRSLAFNAGAIFCGDCDWLLTHDIDCMVQKDFLVNVLSNVASKQTEAVQTFNKRRVLYCNEKLSGKLITGEVDVNVLSEETDGIFTSKGEAPGGSIFVSRNLFFAVGGYDPELFYGYAPEDRMFWAKMSLLNKVGSCDRPVTDIFHLHHEFMGGTNPKLKDMIRTADKFDGLKVSEKMTIISYKNQFLNRWR